jgi:hydroxymethylglutaryl-CoA lyase
MKLPRYVKLVEVGPRDGLQNEKASVPAKIKIELIHRLQDAGLSDIEVTSFVSPKWVPEMADNAQVMAGLRRKPGVRYSVLTPNIQGLTAALLCGPDEIVVFGAASEVCARRNTRRRRCAARRMAEEAVDVGAHAPAPHGLPRQVAPEGRVLCQPQSALARAQRRCARSRIVSPTGAIAKASFSWAI